MSEHDDPAEIPGIDFHEGDLLTVPGPDGSPVQVRVMRVDPPKRAGTFTMVVAPIDQSPEPWYLVAPDNAETPPPGP